MWFIKPVLSLSAAAERCRSFAGSVSGNVAMIFAIALPVMLVTVGGSIDFINLVRARNLVQSGADAASLAGAKELSLTDRNKVNVPAVVEAVVAAYLNADSLRNGVVHAYSVNTDVVDTTGMPMQVKVDLTTDVASLFGGAFGFSQNSVKATSVAVVVGKPNICLLALDPSSMGTLYLQKEAKIIGQNCAVFSNSTHPQGIKAFNSSVLSASMICSAGGRAGNSANFNPEPVVDCPQFSDPLAGRPEPNVGGCTANNVVINNATISLTPGTYCGGLQVIGSSRVTLSPGLYTIKDGPLLVSDSSSITGSDIGFYLVGTNARFSFATATTVDLTAPKTGPLAGILVFASRGQAGLVHEIKSDNARRLLGTIYLPTGELSIDANKPIADQSAYTAIVALRVKGNSGPTITLNTNYETTDVPVPEGIKGANQPVALIH